ncbi:MAG: MFS transporter [Planctomycetaceae bacterium]|nr:MFS transporter [Planctomycetaceae bacterium]MCB9950227.1 MFS transporter [Planctomycetaceae bacterium]
MTQSQESQPTMVRYQVLALLTLSSAIAYLTRSAVSVAESTIRIKLGLSLVQSGTFMGMFFWSYALLQIPGGWLAYEKGAKYALMLFMICGAVATFCIGIAPGLWLLLLAQLVMGAAQAGLFPAACYSISHWVPVTRRAFACGVLTMGMQVGAVAASILTAKLIGKIDWRFVFVIYSIPGFIWVITFRKWFHNSPQDDPHVNAAERRLIQPVETSEESPTQKMSVPWMKILCHRGIWFLCGQQVCRGAGYMFFASWFPTFLQKTRNVSVTESGYLQALVFSGTLVGCLCGGWLTDWLLNRTGNLRLSRSLVGTTFLMACSLLILAAWFVESTTVAMGLLTLGVFFAALAGPCAFSATMDIGGDYVPQVFGLMNMTGNLAAAACPVFVGYLFRVTTNWGLVLLVFAAIYALGAASWLFVDVGEKIHPDKSEA